VAAVQLLDAGGWPVSTARGLGPSSMATSEVTLVELVDRLVDKGVVLHGDITLAVADIDLIYVGLRALISSVSGLERGE
jgi:gas vesicle structural protein